MNRLPRLLPAAALGCLLLGGFLFAQPGGSPGYATLVVKVPESATLKIGDYVSTQKGAVRTLYTPNLEPGHTYYYMVEATWTEGGKDKKLTRKLEFQSGKTVSLELGTTELKSEDKKEPKKDKLKKVDEPKKEVPKNVEPKKVEVKKDELKKEQPKKVDPKKDEPKKTEPNKDEVKKTELKKDEPKKVNPKKADPKKEEPKKIDTRVLGKSRTFLFTYSGEVKDLKPGAEASVWLPVPQDLLEQVVEIVAKTLPANGSFHKEKEYGNKALYFEAKADKNGTIPFKVVYRVTRREVKSDVKANVTLEPRGTEKVSRFLEPDKLVPVEGKPLSLIKDKKLPSNDQFAAAKVLYDVVDNHMKYDKTGKGWGTGDAVWACDSKFGNCTDFHALFISMARGTKIPSKFEMGFSIPAKRGAGTIGGYHCWAWFMPNRKGWVPVDISEANRFPEMKDYYFGNLTEDRVQFSTGRDITLEPRQKGPALNFFVYPYVEVDGKEYPRAKVGQSFAYQDVK